MFDVPLKAETGYVVAECGKNNPSCYVYLDDGLFTGNTILKSLRTWLKDAPAETQVHVIVIALHRGGLYYAKTNLEDAATEAEKKIEFTWWRIIELEERRIFTDESDVLRPTKIPNDAPTKAYVEALGRKQVLRTPGNVGKLKIFSSEEGRDLLEQRLLIKGVHIRDIAPNLPEPQRPLGNTPLKTVGFGSTIVTFRNCPNNAPLAFWVGDPWYPLFPRKTN